MSNFYDVFLKPVSIQFSDTVPNKDDKFNIHCDVLCDSEMSLKFKTGPEVFSSSADSIEASIIIRSDKDSTKEHSCVICQTGHYSDDQGVRVTGLVFLILTNKTDYSELIDNIRAGLYPSFFSVFIESELLNDEGVWDNVDKENREIKLENISISYKPMDKIWNQATEKPEGAIKHNPTDAVSRKDILKRIESIRNDLKITKRILMAGCIILLVVLINSN